MTWQDRPHRGERWRRPKTKDHTQETRTVVDRTLGGAVCYRVGRPYYRSDTRQCTEAQWHEWQKTAKEMPRTDDD